MKYFAFTANILIGSAVLFYVLGWIALLLRKTKTGWTFTAIAWLVSVSLICLNGLAANGLPLGNMYQVLMVLSLFFVPLFLLLALKSDMAWAATYFTILPVLPLMGGLFMEKNEQWRRMPALQSAWFAPHVLAYMIAYALATIAIVMLAAKWGKRIFGSDETRYNRAAHAILRTAFPFMTFGLLSGALWAEQAWGQYWSWDTKEIWSLIMWMFYLIYLHAMKLPAARKWADLAHLLGYLSLLVTFFLVNLLPKLGSILHGYA